MEFNASDEEVKQILCNAVNASIPVGMGFLQYQKGEYKEVEMAFHNSCYSIDYYDGRMVKLAIKELAVRKWKVLTPDKEPNIEYQSWAVKYPTTKELIESVLTVPY